jgi:hypothetical protein
LHDLRIYLSNEQDAGATIEPAFDREPNGRLLEDHDAVAYRFWWHGQALAELHAFAIVPMSVAIAWFGHDALADAGKGEWE